jgi:biopolymer transport protein ExbD
MAIHSPGSRLLSSVPFKVLGGKGKQGQKSVLVQLNLTALVDMMTMLVVFLLISFSATGQLSLPQGVVLPDAAQQTPLHHAPIITVTNDAILFNGETVGDTRALMAETSTEFKILDLYERLKIEKASIENGIAEGSIATGGGGPEQDPEIIKTSVILQADKSVDAKVLNRIMKTCYAAEFPNIMFAVNSRGRR